MKSRTIGAIVLGPRLIQGRYDFMSLETGAQINGRVVAVLPVTPEVIARVEMFGQNQKQPYRASKMLKYEWRPGRAVDDDDATIDVPAIANDTILPAPVYQPIPDAGPNPFALNAAPGPPHTPQGAGVDVDVHPHRDEDQDVTPGDEDIVQEEAQGAHDENQGAQEEAQGAQEHPAALIENINELQQIDEESEANPEDTDSDSDTSSLDTADKDRQDEEKNRRSRYFEAPTESEGRGKRD